MNTTALYIARRYLFARQRRRVVNIISAIAVVGVATATMALVVVMSVFNGFADLVATFFTTFDPQLKVVPVAGKRVAADTPALDSVRALPVVDLTADCLDDQALALYQGHQQMAHVKGVDDNFVRLTSLPRICYGQGDPTLEAADLAFAIPGIRLAYDLGMPVDYDGYLHLYAPYRASDDPLAEQGFVQDSLLSSGLVFSVRQARYDSQYLLTSLTAAQRLFQADGEISSLELRLRPDADPDKAKALVQQTAGPTFRVLDRYQQHDDTFAIMKVEKLMAYIFLTFILVVATCNVIGSLSMLIIDKRADTDTLRALGASERMVRAVFTLEGWLISLTGAVIGTAAGLLLCLLQQQYGLVRLGQEAGQYVVDAYPVSVHYTDVAIVFATAIAVGLLATLPPVAYATRKTK